MKHRHLTACFVFCVLLVLSVGGGLAISSTLPASGDVPLQTNSNLTVIYEGEDYPLNPFIDDTTIDATNGSISGSNATIRIPDGFDINGNQTVIVDNADGQVRINKSDSPTVGFTGNLETVTVTSSNHIKNDGQTDIEYNATGQANISFFNQQPNQPLSLIDANSGELLALSDSNADGNVTFNNIKEGSHTAFIRSGSIKIKTISRNPQLVDNSTNVTIRLFEADTERVIRRTTSSGEISLAEFPEQTKFTAVAAADGFVTRRTFISQIREQQRIYLLDNSTTTSLVRFTIEDRTGQFSGDAQTTLKISRSINTSKSASDNEEYQIVSGDIVGGQLTFDAELQENIRYRVSVSNQDGDTRQLGAFLIKGNRNINLVISGIDQGVDVPDNGPVITTNKIDGNNSKTVEFTYTDNQSETDAVEVRIENAANSSDVIAKGEKTGNISEFKYQAQVSGSDAEKRLVANYSYDRNGQQEQAAEALGKNSFPLFTQLDQGYQTIFGVGFLLISASLFSVANVRIGAIVLPGIGLFLNLIGMLSGEITLLAIGISFSIGIGINLISQGIVSR